MAPLGPLWATSVFSVRKVAPACVYGATTSDYYHKDGGKMKTDLDSICRLQGLMEIVGVSSH